MRKILFSIFLTAISPVISGCSSSLTVSEYAGVPRDQLPRDHMDYRAAGSTRAPRIRDVVEVPVQPETRSSALSSIDEENRRLSRMTNICQGCVAKNQPSASYTRQEIPGTGSDALASVSSDTKIPK
jgi:hypothetical protein